MGFEQEEIDSIAWREDGNEVAVATYDFASGDGVIRLLPFPALQPVVELQRSPDVLSLNGLAAGPDGYAWLEHADGGVNLVRSTVDGRHVLGYITSPLSSLRARGSSLLAVDERFGGEIVRIDVNESGLDVVPVTDVDGIVHSFDVAPDGRIVYMFSHGPGTEASFVVLDGPTQKTLTPSGHLIGHPIFGADRDDVYFEDHDVGALRAVDIASGVERIVLSTDVSVVAVSPNGDIAHTFVSPTETHKLCVDVQALPVSAASRVSARGTHQR